MFILGVIPDNITIRWRIQDFPEVEAPILGGEGRQHTILPNFPKLKEFGPQKRGASKILLCRSAIAISYRLPEINCLKYFVILIAIFLCQNEYFSFCDLFDPGGVFQHLDPSHTTNTLVVHRKHTKKKADRKQTFHGRNGVDVWLTIEFFLKRQLLDLPIRISIYIWLTTYRIKIYICSNRYMYTCHFK